MKEKTVENKIKKFLKDNNIYYFKYHGGNYSRSGVPDLICCVKGYFVGIEVKNDKGKTTILQDENIKLINNSGGIAFVARSIDDVRKILYENKLI